MGTPGIIFVSSIILFTVSAVMVRVEYIKNRRLVLQRVRGWLDVHIESVEKKWSYNWKHLSRYVVQLGWYYSIHSLLKTLLSVLISLYAHIEQMFERNRLRTKQLRKELKRHVAQTHLTDIAHHRRKTALSPEEQTLLKSKTLENDHT